MDNYTTQREIFLYIEEKRNTNKLYLLKKVKRMQLKSLIKIIKKNARDIPNVGYVEEGSVYDLNQDPDTPYTAVVISQKQHSYDMSRGMFNYSFNIFYVDRLTEDKSNKLEIQSIAVQALKDLLIRVERDMDGNIIFINPTFDTFTEKFTTQCAGAYMSIRMEVPESWCE